MKRALTTVAIAVGFVGFAAAPAGAAEYAAGPSPVTVTVGDDNVAVGSGLPRQPLLGARADLSDGYVCAGFSYQVPQCVEWDASWS
ncbi:MAG TPA: hypothetical protein VNA12_05040 [Mycobacteriales bacterium]|nr:hypothetical protein [Mycobacteriales bacterium]